MNLKNVAVVGGISVLAVMLAVMLSPGFRLFLATGKWTAPPAA